VTVEILLQTNAITNQNEIFKNKFMIQASPTELQQSENFKLASFWEEKAATKDKSNMQQNILKINFPQDETEP
jgi:hypothetical protein